MRRQTALAASARLALSEAASSASSSHLATSLALSLSASRDADTAASEAALLDSKAREEGAVRDMYEHSNVSMVEGHLERLKEVTEDTCDYLER